jgi:hypothetical protein
MPPEQVKELQKKAAQMQRTNDPKEALALISAIQAAIEEDRRAHEQARRNHARVEEVAAP